MHTCKSSAEETEARVIAVSSKTASATQYQASLEEKARPCLNE